MEVAPNYLNNVLLSSSDQKAEDKDQQHKGERRNRNGNEGGSKTTRGEGVTSQTGQNGASSTKSR